MDNVGVTVNNKTETIEVVFYETGMPAASSTGTPGGGPVTDVVDASADTKGILKLAGALGGTADNPTVPELDDKADDSDVVHNTGNEEIGGVKKFLDPPIFPDSSISGSQLKSAVRDSLAKADSALQHPSVLVKVYNGPEDTRPIPGDFTILWQIPPGGASPADNESYFREQYHDMLFIAKDEV